MGSGAAAPLEPPGQRLACLRWSRFSPELPPVCHGQTVSAGAGQKARRPVGLRGAKLVGRTVAEFWSASAGSPLGWNENRLFSAATGMAPVDRQVVGLSSTIRASADGHSVNGRRERLETKPMFISLKRGEHWRMGMIKPIGRLVPVSFKHCCFSTPGLSTWWSTTALIGSTRFEVSFPLRCLQRLSSPYIATLLCGWRHNRSTRGTSIPVLSY